MNHASDHNFQHEAFNSELTRRVSEIPKGYHAFSNKGITYIFKDFPYTNPVNYTKNKLVHDKIIR